MIILIFSSSLAILSRLSSNMSSESILSASVGQDNTHTGLSLSMQRLHFFAIPDSFIWMAPTGQASRQRPQPIQISSSIIIAPSISSIAPYGQTVKQGALSGEQWRQNMGTPLTTRIAFWGQFLSHFEHSSHNSGMDISSFMILIPLV